MKRAMRAIMFTAASAALLGGCAEFNDARRAEEDAMHKSESSRVPSTDDSLISVSDQPYLVGDLIKPGKSVPDILKPAVYSFELSSPVPLRVAAMRAGMETHIPVHVLPDADDDGESDTTPVAFLPGAGQGSNGLALPPPPSLMAGGTTGHAGQRRSAAIQRGFAGKWFQYSGTKGGLFEALAEQFGVSERWTGSEINFFRYQTKTYEIPAFQGKESNTASITAVTGGGSSGSGGGSGGGMTGGGGMSSMGGGSSGSSGSSSGESQGMSGVYAQSTTDQWAKMHDAAVQAADGARVVSDENLGIITITGTPDQIAGADQWYESLKKMLMTQVAVTIHVYSVKLTHESNYGFSPQIATKQLGKYFTAATTPAAIPVIQSQDVPFSFGASIVKGPLSGTNVAAQALQSLDNSTELYERGVVTTNGTSAPFQHGTDTTYIQNASSYLATNAGSSASISPGVVMDGFEGSVTPRLVDGKIMLNLHFLIQTVLSLHNLSGNNSVTIQGPKTAGTTLTDKVILSNGEMLVLSGFVGDSTGRKLNGVGSPFNWLFGGGGDAQTVKDRLVITVEAHTL